ncbi:MAG: T9SS type A sorting domain-containing protein [Bacteroidota bacterium]
MKQLYTLLLVLLGFSKLSTAQQICMVTADFDEGTNYIVAYYEPWDALYDSVYIYRKTEGQALYYKIGARSVSGDLSFFIDSNANTIQETYYKISYLDTNGVESPLSLYHKPVVLDYTGPSPGGTLVWTLYEIENEVDQTYIWSYELYKDNLGLGDFYLQTYWPGGQAGAVSWYDYDTNALFAPVMQYYMETNFTSCAITSRANINTSRSNIKNQFSNDVAAVTPIEKEDVLFLIPNPMSDQLNVLCNQQFVGEHFLIIDSSGKVVVEGEIDDQKMNLNLTSIEKGQYLFVVSKGKKSYAKPFIKH